LLDSPPVRFVVGEARKEFWIHKSLLTKLRSKTIDALLPKTADGAVEWPHVNEQTFGRFLEFVYSRTYQARELEEVTDDAKFKKDSATKGETMTDDENKPGNEAIVLGSPADSTASSITTGRDEQVSLLAPNTIDTGASTPPAPPPRSKLGFAIPDLCPLELVHDCGRPDQDHKPNNNNDFVRSLPKGYAEKRQGRAEEFCRYYGRRVDCGEIWKLMDYTEPPIPHAYVEHGVNGHHLDYCRNDDPSVSYQLVFKAYVRMHKFSEEYDISSLWDKTLRKLWAQLYVWVLHPERVDDVVFLVKCVYVNTTTKPDDKWIRECVLRYVAVVWYDLSGYPEWREFVEEGGKFVEDITRFLECPQT
jgi:hypothetical protein